MQRFSLPQNQKSRPVVQAVAWLCALCFAAPATAVAIDGTDQQFVEGLRTRRLFSLAETFCLKQLDAPQLGGQVAADWSIELIRVYSDQAVNLLGPARETAWRKAAEVAEQFEVNHPNHLRQPLVRVQAALALLAQGELARMEAEVGAAPAEPLALARTTIREAARSLEQIDDQLTDAIPLAARNASKPGALSAAELSSLQQNVRFQWARALRNQALCYAAASADRVAALTQAIEKLGQPLQVLPSDDPLVAKIKIDQSVCQRLLGELKLAATILDGLDAAGQAVTIRLVARAESLRLLVAAGQLDAAVQTLAQGRTIDGVASPELDFAHLEVYVAKWRETGSGATGKQWEQQSVKTLEFIEQTHGPYWARRAELLLVSVNMRVGSGSVSILERAARDMYLKGRLGEAVAAYDKAAQAAETAQNGQQAFALAYKAALIQQQRQKFADAAARFRQLARLQPESPLAGNAHLVAVVNLAQEAKADASLLSDYESWLREHLQLWPASDSAHTARLWAGQLYESQQKWELAVNHFSAIVASSEHYQPAATSALRCWTRWLAALSASGEPLKPTAEAAIRYANSALRRNGDMLPTSWGGFDGDLLISLARLQLRYFPDDANKLEPLLRQALENAQPAVTWRNAAQTMLVLAVLKKPNGQFESQRILAQIGDASTDQLLEILSGVEQAADETPQLAASIGKLERDLAQRLLSAERPLTSQQELRVTMIYAAALVKLGDTAGALSAYAELAQKHQNQADVQLAYGEQLLASDNKETLKSALTQWRNVARKSRPRTSRWFQAKYSVALAQYKLGDKEAAAKLIRYLQATEDLAASGLQREFRELLERCK